MAKARGDGSMTEVLRRWWIHSSDSTRVQKAAEDTAISSLNARKSRKPKKNWRSRLPRIHALAGFGLQSESGFLRPLVFGVAYDLILVYIDVSYIFSLL